jgi:hypothetical protein
LPPWCGSELLPHQQAAPVTQAPAAGGDHYLLRHRQPDPVHSAGHPFRLAGVALGILIPSTMFCFGFVETHAMRVLGIQSGTMAVSVILPAQLPAILSGWLCIY